MSPHLFGVILIKNHDLSPHPPWVFTIGRIRDRNWYVGSGGYKGKGEEMIGFLRGNYFCLKYNVMFFLEGTNCHLSYDYKKKTVTLRGDLTQSERFDYYDEQLTRLSNE